VPVEEPSTASTKAFYEQFPLPRQESEKIHTDQRQSEAISTLTVKG